MKKIVATALLTGAVLYFAPIGYDLSGFYIKEGSVILYRTGQIRESDVRKIGQNCYVSWYNGIDKVVIHADGTAVDSPFYYRWTRATPGPIDRSLDASWFNEHCSDKTP